MTLSIIKLPTSMGVGAQVTYTDSTAKNVSTSGNAGRKSLRPVKRTYTCSVSPSDSDEVQKIIMAVRGRRYPLALRDPSAYKFSNDLMDVDVDGNALLGRRWTPATGDLEYFQRVMIPDGSAVFTLNGSPSSPTVQDYGVVDFGHDLTAPDVSGGDQAVIVSGNYLTPVCLMDDPSSTAITSVGGVVVYQFSDLRFEEIFEAEFRALTA